MSQESTENSDIDLIIMETNSFQIPDLSGNSEPILTIDEEIKIKSETTLLNAENIVNQSVFSLGISNPITYNKSKRTRNNEVRVALKRQKVSSTKKIKNTNQEPEQAPVKTLKELANTMMNLFTAHNPYYVTSRVNHKVNTKAPPYEFLNNKAHTGHIKITIPLNKPTLRHFLAYQAILYKTGTLFDWQVTLGELDTGGELFQFHKDKNTFKTRYAKPLLNDEIYYEVEKIFYNNQWMRWQMKRLVLMYLQKKCKKRTIGEDNDIITGETIPKEEQVRIISIRNRTTYVFSGQVLVKTAKACLEGQTGAIPHVKTPHNPYTNTPFTYGELVKVYGEILTWCAKKGKALPGIIALYREYKFKNNMLLRVNHNYIQMKATESYILNDDVSGEFFIETMELILNDYELMLDVEFDSALIGYQRFRLWNQMEPKYYLVIAWKKLASDYWYYKQTEQFPRENWRSEASIYTDILILLKASIPKLRVVSKEYQRRRALAQTQVNGQANRMP